MVLVPIQKKLQKKNKSFYEMQRKNKIVRDSMQKFIDQYNVSEAFWKINYQEKENIVSIHAPSKVIASELYMNKWEIKKVLQENNIEVKEVIVR